MSRDIEKIIIINHRKFDKIEQIDEDKIWMGISYDLDHNKDHSRSKIWLSIAATLIFLLASSVGYLSLEINNKQELNYDQLLTNTFPELKNEFNDFNNQIHARKAALAFDTINPENFPDLFSEMETLNNDYETAISDLRNIGKEQAILRVLMRYHQRQLDLLERLSNEIEKKKLYYEKNNQHSIY